MGYGHVWRCDRADIFARKEDERGIGWNEEARIACCRQAPLRPRAASVGARPAHPDQAPGVLQHAACWRDLCHGWGGADQRVCSWRRPTRRQSSGHDLLCLQSPHIVRMQGRGAQTLGRPRRSECILGASKQQVLTVEDGPRRSRPYRATHATDRAPTSAPQLDRCTARAPARRRAAQHWLAPSPSSHPISLAPEASLSCRLGGQDVKTRTPEATTRRADCGCTRA